MCGILGIFAPNEEVARLVFFSLVSLQHRGQESAGIATSDGGFTVNKHQAAGLVSQAFTEDVINRLTGYMGVGHARYPTSGRSQDTNAQPITIETQRGPLSLAHNGNLPAAADLRKKLLQRGVGLFMSSDTELIAQLLSSHPQSEGSAPKWEEAIQSFMSIAEGSYSLVMMAREGLYACRDPLGNRPLALGSFKGKDGETKYIVASESCSFLTIGATFVRDILPGEIIRIDKHGVHSTMGTVAPKPALCVFEYVYFARPDTRLEGQLVHLVRQKLGEKLAEETNIEADVVCGVPDSAIPAAIGFARKLGLPYSEALTKNRYIHRTFIAPDDRMRKNMINLKFNPLHENLKDKRVILVDDSIVRGNTSAQLVKIIREAGAKEIHMVITSPPIRHPCYMGIDMATHEELIAPNKTVDEIAQTINADSVYYLSEKGMLDVVQEGLDEDKSGHCSACFSGGYPLQVEW